METSCPARDIHRECGYAPPYALPDKSNYSAANRRSEAQPFPRPGSCSFPAFRNHYLLPVWRARRQPAATGGASPLRRLNFRCRVRSTKALGIDGPNDETVTNRQDIRYDYGNLDYYAHHELALNYSYNLPVGTGQLLLGSSGPWLNRLIGGWKLVGVWKATSGTPFSVSFNSSTNGLPSGRADRVPGAPLYPATSTIHQWFNSSAFAPVVPPNYRYGTSQRNMMFGPRFSEWDTGVLKDFKITEKVNFQFRQSI